MTYRGLLTEEAKAELDHEIAYSKERWGAKHATVYKRELLEQVRKIVRNPMLYPLKPDLGDGLRSVRHKGNYIIYALDDEKKVVLIVGFPSIYKQFATPFQNP